jgi:hypothetical protein
MLTNKLNRNEAVGGMDLRRGGLLRGINGMILWMSSRRYWREYMFNTKQIIGGMV